MRVTRDLRPHTMTPVRARYLAAARTALELLAAPEVRDRWDEASALALLSVGDLAGHLALSGVLIVESVLDGPDPRSPAPISAGQYYGAFLGARTTPTRSSTSGCGSARLPSASAGTRTSSRRRPGSWCGWPPGW